MKRNLYSGFPSLRGRVELDLRRQVGAGVLLLPHRQRGELGVAQVQLGVGVVDAAADRLAVVGAGEHALGLLAHHDRGAGVLAHRQHAAGGDVGVLEQVERDEAVVPRRLGVVDDLAQLGEVRRAQVVADVVHRLAGQALDRLGRDPQEGLPVGLEGGDALGRDQPVRRVVGAGREEVGVAELGLGAHAPQITPVVPRRGPRAYPAPCGCWAVVRVHESIVIGAGQAGLASSYHLARLGIDHLVLDANPTPGGAWQHRWDSLTMDDVHGIADLPGAPAPAPSRGRANVVLADWFAAYEREHDLPVVRPVTVDRVTDEGELLVVHAGDRSWTTRTIVNSTGTWTRPFVPHYPGVETFRGEQLHTVDYPGPEHFRGRRVLVVGGGASAVQLLGEIAPGHRHRLGDPSAAGLAVGGLRPRGRPGRGGAGGAAGTAWPAAGQRRQRHRARAARAGARGRAPRRLRAPADVRPDRAGRGALGRRRVRARRRDPLGHRLPAGGRPPGAAAPAQPHGGILLDGRPRSPTRGCSWSATGRRPARSAPTGPGGRPRSRWLGDCGPRLPESARRPARAGSASPRWRRPGSGTPRTRRPRHRRSRAPRPGPGA